MKRSLLAAIMIIANIAAFATTYVRWSTEGNTLDEDGKRCYVQRFDIYGDTDFNMLAFNMFARQMKPVDKADKIVEIVPGYYAVKSSRFAKAAPGDTITVRITTRGNLLSVCYTPDGVHTIKKDGSVGEVVFSRADILADPRNWQPANAPDPMPYGDTVYARNEEIRPDSLLGFYDIIPAFKSVDLLGSVSPRVNILHSSSIPAPIPNYFKATIQDGTITIEASRGYLGGALRRLAALGLDTARNIPDAIITDYPDFRYRGLMIDIARNFQTPAQLRRILVLMSRYGLNVLHFHFADDEAWRLEIPGLPELTEVGGRRGYTVDEHEYLAQIFTGNGDPEAVNSSNGFFTREDFIALLQFADSLGIKVLPEVESPGHARAAILAMEKRFRDSGDDYYRLIDPKDKSRYTSAQAFHDNVMNPALPGPVRFMTHVASELKKMYQAAGLSMPALHIGGDEVANGAWTRSPVAKKYMKRHGITDERELHLVFVRELLDSLTALDIPVSGWQEIAVGHSDEYNDSVRPHVFSVNCWSTLGSKKSVTVQSVTSGYPTVLSNANHFYMDMCYSPHPCERGLSWSGYVDEFTSLAGYPYELCPVELQDRVNILGVSGHLFAETLRSGEMLETYLLPKMLGLAERAWNAEPTWSDRQFNTIISEREIPFWNANDFNFHLRQPGIIILDGKVVMNSPYPDCLNIAIRFTTDGSEPTPQSPLYTEPFDAGDITEIRAAIFFGSKSSVTSILRI